MKFYFTLKRYLRLCRAICRASVMVPFQLIILLYSSLPFYSDCFSWSPSQWDVHSFIEFSFGLSNELFILDIFQVKTAFIVETLCFMSWIHFICDEPF